MHPESAAQPVLQPPPIAASATVERALFIGLGIIIALSPLPLGSGRPIAWDMIGLCLAFLLGAYALFVPAERVALPKYLLIPAVSFLAFVVFVLFQAWVPPLPAFRNPVWDISADALNRNVAGSIAIDRQIAMSGLLRLLSYAGVFLLAMKLGRDPLRAFMSIKLVMLTGTAYATYGLLVYWTGNKQLLWFAKWAYPDDLTGSFVNRNSFATYLGLCLLATFAYLIVLFGRLSLRGSWRNKLATVAEYTSKHVWLLICLFLIATALLLTHSRGGFAAAILGTVALMIAVSRAPGMKTLRYLGWLLMLVVVIAVAFLASGATMIERFFFDADMNSRMSVYALTTRAILDYPIFGTGLGSFAEIFPIYRTAAITGYYDMAHNDYLQNLLELGIPATAMLLIVTAWLFALCVRGMQIRRRDVIYPCLGIATSVLVGFHAGIDFSLQIPAVTYTYMFILGVAVAQSRPSREAV